MKYTQYLFSLPLFLAWPVTASATQISGNISLPDSILHPAPDARAFGAVQRVLPLSYDDNSRPLIYLTGLNKTEDAKPFKFTPIHFDRLGAKNSSSWVLKGAAIELVNDDNVALELVVQDANGQKQLLQVQEKHSVEFTAAQPGSYEIYLANHYSERAYLLVSSEYYVRQVDNDFNYIIEDLPPGNATVNLWFRGEVISAAARDIPDDGDVTTCFFVNNEGALVGDSCENARKNKRR